MRRTTTTYNSYANKEKADVLHAALQISRTYTAHKTPRFFALMMETHSTR